MRRRPGIAVAVPLALLLAGCAARPPKPPPAPSLPILSGEQCLGDLATRGVDFRLAPLRASAGPCAVDTSVEVSRAAVAWNQPALMSCGLADRLDRFLVEAAEPLALRYLGSTITRFDHFGAYSCRREIGQAGRWSEHAAGRAIDVSGFVTAEGRRIKIEQEWNRPGPTRDFLRAIASRACDYFNVVLTPDSDRYHYNHLHFDIGPWRLCQTRARTSVPTASGKIDSGGSP